MAAECILQSKESLYRIHQSPDSSSLLLSISGPNTPVDEPDIDRPGAPRGWRNYVNAYISTPPTPFIQTRISSNLPPIYLLRNCDRRELLFACDRISLSQIFTRVGNKSRSENYCVVSI